ncbi:MAG: hypothetical protein ACE5D7_10865, partial [Fidelibacterota bacterium]
CLISEDNRTEFILNLLKDYTSIKSNYVKNRFILNRWRGSSDRIVGTAPCSYYYQMHPVRSSCLISEDNRTEFILNLLKDFDKKPVLKKPEKLQGCVIVKQVIVLNGKGGFPVN